MKSVALRSSGPHHPSGARKLRSVPGDDDVITVTVVVRAASSASSRAKQIREIGLLLPQRRDHFNLENFTRKHGARRKHLRMVEDFAVRNGLQVLESSRARRCVVLSGAIGRFRKVFAIDFAFHQHEGGKYRSHLNPIRLPADLAEVVEAVFGLEDRPLMKHHAFAKAGKEPGHTTPREVATTYNFPATTGKGQRIAIVELGGGFYQSDLEAFFGKLKLKVPNITTIELDGQRNDPSPQQDLHEVLTAMGVTGEAPGQITLDKPALTKVLWTIEATLDIQLAGAFANDAEIVVYFAPNNSQGKYHALTSAIQSKDLPSTIISCSWGAVEEDLSPEFASTMDHVFQDAALRGITICFSSGDKGEDPGKNGNPRVHFPASSPSVLSCGGTHWDDSSKNRVHEVVWNEKITATYTPQTGGGVSRLFELPSWQSGAGVVAKTGTNGRGVPDVSSKADMVSGYEMIVGGEKVTMGGTSSAVPAWAGLIARLNQELRKNIGYLTPLLYEEEFAKSFNDITEGNNGAHYKAEPGWDACTGLGTPDGEKLLIALGGKRLSTQRG